MRELNSFVDWLQFIQSRKNINKIKMKRWYYEELVIEHKGMLREVSEPVAILGKPIEIDNSIPDAYEIIF